MDFYLYRLYGLYGLYRLLTLHPFSLIIIPIDHELAVFLLFGVFLFFLLLLVLFRFFLVFGQRSVFAKKAKLLIENLFKVLFFLLEIGGNFFTNAFDVISKTFGS